LRLAVFARAPEGALRHARNAEPDGDSDTIRALVDRPFVLHRASGGSQVIKLERSAGAGRAPRRGVELTVSGRVNVDDYAALAELVAAGQGVGLMPAIHVRDGVSAGRLARIFPAWSSRAPHVYLVYPTRQHPERVRLLTEFLLAAFAEHGSV
jgi:DNA-binding transcriptional LysR family regulator